MNHLRDKIGEEQNCSRGLDHSRELWSGPTKLWVAGQAVIFAVIHTVVSRDFLTILVQHEGLGLVVGEDLYVQVQDYFNIDHIKK